MSTERFRFVPAPERTNGLREGVTTGWLILRDGEAARACKTFALADGEGGVVFEQDGEWQDVQIVDRRP